MKCIMVVFTFMFANPLQCLANLVFSTSHFFDDVTHKLLMVMVLTPMMFNTIQYWLVDNIFIDAHKTEALKIEKRILRKENKEQRDRLTQAASSTEQLRKELAGKDQQLEQLRGQVQDHERDLKAKDKTLYDQRTRIQGLEDQQAELMARLEAQTADGEQLTAALKGTVTVLQQERAELEGKIAELTGERDELRKQVRDLEQQHQDWENGSNASYSSARSTSSSLAGGFLRRILRRG
mmetsp:Transcript_31390/g.71309  ORF Transcript_31390/g.71309 Transcript_31390/m.71309 type:complete len:237 (-) Transcript_31390:11-721(-)